MILIIFFIASIILIGILLYNRPCEKDSEMYGQLQLDKCYPPVGIEFLKKYRGNIDIEKLFEVERIINPLEQKNKAISCSLFCKDVNIHNEGEKSTPDMSEGGKWYQKYMKPFIENVLDGFQDSDFYKNGWKIRLYLANDLGVRYESLLSRYRYLEIYIMKSSSIGAVPGTLWRYLSYGDYSLDMVLVMDIDTPPINEMYYLVKEFNKYPEYMMLKADYAKPEVIGKDTDAINSAVVLGQRHLVRPSLLRLKNINEIMSAFITYRINTSNKQFYGENDTENICNKSYEKHIYGWGNHWLMYCFDERFLKHVIFYYIVQKGGMISLYDKKTLEQYPQEYNYVMKTNNKNIYIDAATVI